MRYPKIVNVAEKSLDEHKAENIEVIDVKSITPFSDYYVLATASNERALKALADFVVDDLAKNKFDTKLVEGTPESGWMIVDANEVIVHLFSPEKREEIKLDDLVEHVKEKTEKKD
jgi:ribosome-associated protein